jgi:hypothetical protein
MNFEVNGIPYLLTFDPGMAQWCLLTPSGDGFDSVEIHDDGTPLDDAVPGWRDSGGNWHMD